MAANLIGSRISLISNKDIRYEGVLFAINQQESSVTLQNGRYAAPFIHPRGCCDREPRSFVCVCVCSIRASPSHLRLHHHTHPTQHPQCGASARRAARAGARRSGSRTTGCTST